MTVYYTRTPTIIMSTEKHFAVFGNTMPYANLTYSPSLVFEKQLPILPDFTDTNAVTAIFLRSAIPPIVDF